MVDFFDRWVSESDEHAKLVAEEALILEVTESIWAILEKKNLSKADLADLLQKRRSDITQLLNGNRNMTLRTLADIAFALDTRVKIWLGNKKDVLEWQEISAVVSRRDPVVPFSQNSAVNDNWNNLEPLERLSA